MSTPEHREAILKRHEKLLWWMRDQERFTFLAELRADYIFEEELAAVAGAMASEGGEAP